jgi:hypothetical protein
MHLSRPFCCRRHHIFTEAGIPATEVSAYAVDTVVIKDFACFDNQGLITCFVCKLNGIAFCS